jgi:A/G-specific adenine glycosylase
LAGEMLWNMAREFLAKPRPGDFNQAMMELGATVCTPRTPSCLACPVIKLCATRGELEANTKTVPQKKREIHYELICRNEEVFLTQRARDASLMPGMWELPELTSPKNTVEPALTLYHSITVTNYTVHVWRVAAPSRAIGKWTPAERLRHTALTGLALKILRAAEII